MKDLFGEEIKVGTYLIRPSKEGSNNAHLRFSKVIEIHKEKPQVKTWSIDCPYGRIRFSYPKCGWMTADGVKGSMVIDPDVLNPDVRDALDELYRFGKQND